MRDYELLEQKGKGRATYYIPGYKFNLLPAVNPVSGILPDHPGALPDHPGTLPDHIKEKLDAIGKRTPDKDKMNALIIALCGWKPLTLKQLSAIVQRNEKYLLENFITPLREAGDLEYTIPDMPNHPDQAYKAGKKNGEKNTGK